MEDSEELTSLAIGAYKILREQLERERIEYDSLGVEVLDVKTVGVQGDQRSYNYVAQIEIIRDGNPLWDPDFLEKLSTSITNNIKGINRVVYTL